MRNCLKHGNYILSCIVSFQRLQNLQKHILKIANTCELTQYLASREFFRVSGPWISR